MSTEEALKHALEDLREAVRISREGTNIAPYMELLKCNPASRKTGFDLRSLNTELLKSKQRKIS